MTKGETVFEFFKMQFTKNLSSLTFLLSSNYFHKASALKLVAFLKEISLPKIMVDLGVSIMNSPL